MKTNFNTILKPITLVITLSFGATAFAETSAFAEESADSYSNSNWQTPLAIEFNVLDTTGNGLLLPNEASKGKAFNSKTFAKADVDHDGYIDQNEYIYSKTGAWPDSVKNKVAADNTSVTNDKKLNTNDTNPTSSAQVTTTAEGDELVIAETANTEASTQERTVGKVIDDSVITAKAKAEILGTPDLKSLQISVDTRDGEVVLSGFVDNAVAKAKAEQAVLKIEGVKSVKNNLEVRI